LDYIFSKKPDTAFSVSFEFSAILKQNNFLLFRPWLSGILRICGRLFFGALL
jgi:hypothetical protein